MKTTSDAETSASSNRADGELQEAVKHLRVSSRFGAADVSDTRASDSSSSSPRRQPKRVHERDLRTLAAGEVPTTCLTLHQPLASLMVYGLKRVEGRGWTSSFRGPLWIHGAAKEVEEGRDEDIEAFYREVYAKDIDGTGEGVKFPKQY